MATLHSRRIFNKIHYGTQQILPATQTNLMMTLLRQSFLTSLLAIFYGPVVGADPSLHPHDASPDEITISERRIQASVADQSIDSPGQIVVVYFTPSDRRPAKDHTVRVRRIGETAAHFYEAELRRHGFADRKMNVLRDDAGNVRVIDVVGKFPDSEYGKPDGAKIRKEIVPILERAGIEPPHSVLLMFCNLMDYDSQAGTISHHSPYYGGGSHLAGNAWQCDSEILDPQRLTDSTELTDGEYGKITVGKHNSIFLGGVIHELGHALSLPHCRQRVDEAVRGTALMGSGNRTFRQELRGEGRGTFLTQAHALRMAAHPAFNSRVPHSVSKRPNLEWSNLHAFVNADKQITIAGSVSSDVPIHGVVAYFDPAGGGDYDATTATAVPDQSGRFRLQSGDLRSGRSGQIRLVVCHTNGATSTKKFPYAVDANGMPNLAVARLGLELNVMIEAIRGGDLENAARSLDDLSKGDPDLWTIGKKVLNRFVDRNKEAKALSIDMKTVDKRIKRIALSSFKPVEASVGWLRPAYDRLPGKERLLSVGGDYFARGIYAHAPARHHYALDGQWDRLTGRCGLKSGSFGKVDFEIIGDGRSLWKSRGVVDGEASDFDVDVQNVNVLQLIVTDGGNGKSSDWGLWIETDLNR